MARVCDLRNYISCITGVVCVVLIALGCKSRPSDYEAGEERWQQTIRIEVEKSVGKDVELELDGVPFYSFRRGVLTGTIPAVGGYAKWQRLRDAAVAIGKWPILGEDQLVVSLNDDDPDYKRSPEEILSEAEKIDVDAWYRTSREELIEERSEKDEPDGEAEDIGWSYAHPERLSPVPLSNETEGMIARSFDSDAKRRVFLLPTKDCWKVNAYLPNGNWNMYPTDEEHVAILRRWHRQYGAEVIEMTHDTFNLILPQRITDPKTASKIAEEQTLYCRDIVEQGTQDATALAKSIQESRVWFFWWD